MTLPGQPTETVPDRWTHATVYGDMWVDPDDDPRERPAAGTDERAVLLDYLRRYRLTLEMKCAGLDAGQLSASSRPSRRTGQGVVSSSQPPDPRRTSP